MDYEYDYRAMAEYTSRLPRLPVPRSHVHRVDSPEQLPGLVGKLVYFKDSLASGKAIYQGKGENGLHKFAARLALREVDIAVMLRTDGSLRLIEGSVVVNSNVRDEADRDIEYGPNDEEYSSLDRALRELGA